MLLDEDDSLRTRVRAKAAAGIAYIETQDFNMIENTISNALMIASGMLCDGAKPSCAEKIATAVDFWHNWI